MKRTIRIFLAAALLALGTALPAAAQPSLTLQPFSIVTGRTAELRVRISDPETTYIGANVKLRLPRGLTVVGAAPGKTAAMNAAADYHVVSTGTTTVITALAYSISDTIVDPGGAILRITLAADADPAALGLAPGESRKDSISFMTSGLVSAATEMSIEHSTATGTVELRTNPFGDINGNGAADAADLQFVINVSLGMGSPQDIDAADLNGDGVVDAADIQLAILAVLGAYEPVADGKEITLAENGEEETDDSAPALVFAEVLPAPRPDNPAVLIGTDSYLYVRIRSEDAIAPDSVRGTVIYGGAVSHAVSWLPIADNDGWAVFWEGVPWQQGETIVMSVEANDASGAAIGPLTYTFTAAGGDAPVTVWQPGYEDYDARALAGSFESNDYVSLLEENAAGSFPAFPGATGLVFDVAPEQLFEVPQRVWIPVPSGADPADLVPYLYLQGTDNAGWYPGEDIAGWMAPDSYMNLTLHGTTYLGFLVHHGGIVRLGTEG